MPCRRPGGRSTRAYRYGMTRSKSGLDLVDVAGLRQVEDATARSRQRRRPCRR